MIVIYKRESGAWDRVGQLSPVEYNTDEKIVKGIKKLESSYLFNRHEYMAKSVDRTMYFENGKIQEF